METTLFALAVAGYFAAAFIWPIWFSWQHHRVWPVVFHREAAPAQRLLGMLLGTLLVGVVVAALLFAVYGHETLGAWRPPLVVRVIGWVSMVIGTIVTVVAQRNMGAAWRIGIDDRPTALVSSGLFRFCRNPIFSGLFSFLAGMMLVCPAWWSIAGVLVTGLAIRVQVVFEEQHLATLHGDAYTSYAARTGRFVPFIGKLSPPAAGALQPECLRSL